MNKNYTPTFMKDVINLEARKLACDIASFATDLYPYDMTTDEVLDWVIVIYDDIRRGEVEESIQFLTDQADQDENSDTERNDALELIARLNAFCNEYGMYFER